MRPDPDNPILRIESMMAMDAANPSPVLQIHRTDDLTLNALSFQSFDYKGE